MEKGRTTKELRPKIAIVGSGASSLGVVSALLDSNINAEVIVYDEGDAIEEPTQIRSGDSLTAYYDDIYEILYRENKRQFPPPKTHLSKSIPKASMEGGGFLYLSHHFGGLTNYWGGTMLPFTDRELQGWPITKEELSPYYNEIARLVGISGTVDALNEYFGNDFSNRPAIKSLSIFSRLAGTANGLSGSQYKFLFGANRCALETRPGNSNSCRYCGECMAGCVVDALFSARRLMNGYLSDGRIRHVKARILRVDPQGGRVEIQTSMGGKWQEGFSKIFICAGCLGSTELLMRSFDVTDDVYVSDNSVYVFPIFYFGKADANLTDEYFGLTNQIATVIPNDSEEPIVQIQIYPSFDYLWRYNMSNNVWRKVQRLSNILRQRVLWARLYFHSDYSQKYMVKLDDGQMTFSRLQNRKSLKPARRIVGEFNRIAMKGNFFLSKNMLRRQKSNSHYSSTFPFGQPPLHIQASAEVANDVFICDATTFPTSPAISPTFTIMANAYRIAWEAIHG